MFSNRCWSPLDHMPPKDKPPAVSWFRRLAARSHKSRNRAERACSFVRVFSSLADRILSSRGDKSTSGHRIQRLGEIHGSFAVKNRDHRSPKPAIVGITSLQSRKQVAKASDCGRTQRITSRRSRSPPEGHPSSQRESNRRCPSYHHYQIGSRTTQRHPWECF